MPSNGTDERNLLARCGRFVSRQRNWIAAFLLAAVGALILLLILSAERRIQLKLRQQAFVQDVERLGGGIVLVPNGMRGAPPPLLAVNLGGVPIDGDLIMRLSAFTTIERLNLDGANLGSEEYRAISGLTALRSLSLAGSNVSDNDIPWSKLQLTTLSLRNTSTTDIGLARLVEMTSLVNLEINDTSVTAAGVQSLKKLASLKTLDLDDTCITNDGVLALQAVKSLGHIRIHVADGLGRRTKELVSPLAGSVCVQGMNPSGHTLWNAAEPWDETLAGVVEVVACEADLDPRQVTQLIEAIGPRGVGRHQMGNYFGGPAQPRRTGEAIKSVAEFLRRLQDPEPRTYEVCTFACDSFTKDDIPQLLDALQAVTNFRDAEYLARYGLYLLLRDGLENPEAARELDRMFAHQDSSVRAIAVYGFSRYGHPFLKDWVPSENAVDFGLPRLLRLSKDPGQTVRLAVSEVLGDLVHHHPNRAPEVMPVLIEMLEQGDFGYVKYSIRKIVEVNSEAARAYVPQLRQLLQNTDRGTSNANFFLEVICDLARGDNALAREVAVDCIERVRDGDPAGGRLLVTLLTPENSEVVPTIVHELLEISASDDRRVAELGQDALALAARAIRDFQAAEDQSPKEKHFQQP